MGPVTEVRQIAQEHIDQQRHPDLPLDSILAVAEESARLERLLVTASSGQPERLAMVCLRTLPPSRRDSRKRIAGGEFLLGTLSMNMDKVHRK